MNEKIKSPEDIQALLFTYIDDNIKRDYLDEYDQSICNEWAENLKNRMAWVLFELQMWILELNSFEFEREMREVMNKDKRKEILDAITPLIK